MLSPAQISAQIEEVAAGRLLVEEFELWFRRASRNFHGYKDEQAKSAIFEVENVLSEYHCSSLDESSVAMELANAIRPFEVKPMQYAYAYSGAERGNNNSGMPLRIPSQIAGSNANPSFDFIRAEVKAA
jgi:hypothetical protein